MRRLLFLMLLAVSCSRRPVVPLPTPTISDSVSRVQITTPHKPDGQVVRRSAAREPQTLNAYPRPLLRVTFPGVAVVTPQTILQLKAAGLEGVEYVDADPAVWSEAQRVGFQVAVIYHDGDKSYVDFLDNKTSPPVGAYNIRDEPNPDVCPIVSTCYQDLQAFAAYTEGKINPGAAIILSAFAAFDPQGRWSTYAHPYYSIPGVEVMAVDWYPWSWDLAPDSYNVLSMLINNTRQYGGLKPIVMYTDAGTFGASSQRQPPVPAEWIIADFNACWAAGAAAVSLFFIPESTPPDPCNCAVKMGDQQWCQIAKAADQITGPASDVNLDGVINLLDWQLAKSACNEALAARICTAIPCTKTKIPLVVKS